MYIWGSADLLSPTDAEYFIGCHLAPTPPVPETKRCRPCASWSPQEALAGTNGVWVGSFHGTLMSQIFIGLKNIGHLTGCSACN